MNLSRSLFQPFPEPFPAFSSCCSGIGSWFWMQEKQEQLLFYSDPWDNSGFYVGTQRQGKFPEFVCGSRLPFHFSRDILSFQPGMCRPRVQVGAEIPSEKRQEMEKRERKKKIPGKFGGFGIIFPLPSLFFPPLPLEGKRRNPSLIPCLEAADGIGSLGLAHGIFGNFQSRPKSGSSRGVFLTFHWHPKLQAEFRNSQEDETRRALHKSRDANPLGKGGKRAKNAK